jgi:S-methylmethionine-dependent homocysteine/selenocysteine methylase
MDRNRITLLDGGTGRELLRVGAPFSQPEWSAKALIEGPQFVTRVHENFVAAGADVITTNSYAIVPYHLGEERFRRVGHELAALAGRLARAVADGTPRPVQVAGCLPPLCGSYRSDLYDPGVAKPILATLVDALAPSVDLWLAETLSASVEAELVAAMIAATGGAALKPLWLSFTLEDMIAPGQAPRLRSGESVVDVVKTCARLGAQAVLFNCSQPEVMGPAVTIAAQTLRALGGPAGDMKIGVYANAFVPLRVTTAANAELSNLRVDVTPAVYLDWARDWVSRGASIVGGCCGIGPEHIVELGKLNAA